MQQESARDNQVVDLNVGGVVHSTSRTTLLRYEGSLLARVIDGHQVCARGADGRIFIDRDGELFKFVLQFLRDGELDVEFLDAGLKQRLAREAVYFQLPDLEKKLIASVEAARVPKASTSVFLRVRLYDLFIHGPDPLGVVAKLPPRPSQNSDIWLYGTWMPALIRLYGQAGYRVVSVQPVKHEAELHFLFQR